MSYKTIPKRHLNITAPGSSTRKYKNKPVEERNPNPAKMKHGIFSKNQIKYDPLEKKYIKRGIMSRAYCSRCGFRCASGDGLAKDSSYGRNIMINNNEY